MRRRAKWSIAAAVAAVVPAAALAFNGDVPWRGPGWYAVGTMNYIWTGPFVTEANCAAWVSAHKVGECAYEDSDPG